MESENVNRKSEGFHKCIYLIFKTNMKKVQLEANLTKMI